LLDEPLGALDRKLREETQFELMRVQRELGTGFVLVTHDQDEAMVMAQRIAVMRAGQIEQIGSPRMIYEEPQSRFVAGFVGDVNLLDGEIIACGDGLVTVRLADGEAVTAAGVGATGAKVTLVVRPEHLQLGVQGLPARVLDSAYRGDMQSLRLEHASGMILRLARFGADVGTVPPMGSMVHIHFAPQFARVLER
jgi:putrescine transport system ATP-binding protein